MTLRNSDLFKYLKDSNFGFSYQEGLLDFVLQKCSFNLSEEGKAKLKESLRLYCINLSKRWKRCNRTLRTFTANNDTWLQEIFKVPEQCVLENPSTDESCVITPARRKAFSDISDRHKRRLTEHLREEYSSDILLFAAKQKLQSEGHADTAMVIDYLMKNQNEAGRIMAFCKNEIKAPLFSKEKCLAMLLNLDLSKSQYIQLRENSIENGQNQWQSYYQVQKAKSDCYPPKDKTTITETLASVDLQAILDLTATRLLTLCEDKLSLYTNVKLTCKWGFDGASNQSMYKQTFEDNSRCDEFIFITSFVPIQLVSDSEVLWTNETPGSTRYCRPIKFEFIRETMEISRNEYQRVENQIKNLIAMQYKNVTVKYEMLFTMIDGKVCTAISNEKSCATCPLCGAKPTEMNDIDKVLNKDVRENVYNFGISNLHAKIRCMEFLLHVSYNLTFKKWSVRNPVFKEQRESTKRKIQEEFKRKLGLLVDIVKHGSGLTHDGNTARRFFSEIDITAEITGLNKELIKRFAIILQTISCGEAIDAKKFGKYAIETAKLFVHHYGWYNMPSSVHKLLIHGEGIISNFSIPIGALSEEASEARNKEFRKYREGHSRKINRVATNEDVLHQLLVTSDPLISSLRSRDNLKKKDKLFPEALELLI